MALRGDSRSGREPLGLVRGRARGVCPTQRRLIDGGSGGGGGTPGPPLATGPETVNKHTYTLVYLCINNL